MKKWQGALIGLTAVAVWMQACGGPEFEIASISDSPDSGNPDSLSADAAIDSAIPDVKQDPDSGPQEDATTSDAKPDVEMADAQVDADADTKDASDASDAKLDVDATTDASTDAKADVESTDAKPDVVMTDAKSDAETLDAAIEAGDGGCPVGLANCSGFCVDLVTDNANCGGCEKICAAGKTCTLGVCL